jgi:hypothetical protein
MMSLKYDQVQDGFIKVYAYNGVQVGEMYIECDGYWVFQPVLRNGYWESWMLMHLGRKLHKLNRKWHQQVIRGLEIANQSQTTELAGEPFIDLSRTANRADGESSDA